MAAMSAYDWEERFAADARRRQVQLALDRILTTSFPAIAVRLQKAEPPRQTHEAPRTPTAGGVKPEPRRSKHDREFVDLNDYLTESSSAESPEEVDPRKELERMEERMAQGLAPVPPRARRSLPIAAANEDHNGDGNGNGDVEMDDAEDDGEEEGEPTSCVVCHQSTDEKRILLCDGCEDEYHMYCLTPPLTVVPQGDWFCPACVAKKTTETAPQTEDVDMDDLPLSKENIRKIKEEEARSMAATSVSIAQTFENDAKNMNELLIHACNCDVARCQDATYREFCSHMKRYLRSACWASHNETWLTYRIAKITAELFAYHSLNCHTPRCNVPMCEDLRAEEYV